MLVIYLNRMMMHGLAKVKIRKLIIALLNFANIPINEMTEIVC